MTRCVLRAMDFGASVIFMAFCAKALLAYFYKDLRLQQKQQRLAVFKDAPSLMQCLRTQSRSGNCCLYRSINVASSASAFELLTRFDTGQRCMRNPKERDLDHIPSPLERY